MTRRLLITLLGLAGWLILGAAPGVAAQRDDQQVREADQALFLALSKSDATAVGKLLDAKFTWTGSDGRTLDMRAVLQAPPQPGAQVGADVKLVLYGRVAVVTSALDQIHALRVWVRSRKGWRALLYHEVTVTKPPADAAAPVKAECENPCRTVPYVPRSVSERGVLAAWQALERAVSKGDGAAWAPYVADEFVVVSNYRLQDKAARIAAINRGGSAPAPLVSATLFDYGDALVMTCLHQPYAGKPIRVSRVWIKRKGAWQMAVSYQTIIQSAAAKVG
jgi:hypothetical protein